ncbi:MAG: flagellin [Pseudomonadota bacterium]
MALRINNLMSLTAGRHLSRNGQTVASAMQRLSSGKRINSASDDAAGFAIAERFGSQVNGLGKARQNAASGVSLVQVAEGALEGISGMLQRIRELVVQAANDTNSPLARDAIQREIDQLINEIDRVASTAEYNGKKLLNGNFTAQRFQVGANSNQTMSIDLDSFRVRELGTYELSGFPTTVKGQNPDTSEIVRFNGESLGISSNVGNAAIVVASGSSAAQIAAQINAETAVTNVSASAYTETEITFSDPVVYNIRLIGDGGVSAPIALNISDPNTAAGLQDAVDTLNGFSTTSGVIATVNDNGNGIRLVHATGNSFEIRDDGINVSGTVITVGGAAGIDLIGGNGQVDRAFVSGEIAFTSDSPFTIFSSDIEESVPALVNEADVESIANISVANIISATEAFAKLDAALAKTSSVRSGIGAIQNRLDQTVDELFNYQNNLSASKSRIIDADFAHEMSVLVRGQILQDASTAMMTQANSLPELIINLIEDSRIAQLT